MQDTFVISYLCYDATTNLEPKNKTKTKKGEGGKTGKRALLEVLRVEDLGVKRTKQRFELNQIKVSRSSNRLSGYVLGIPIRPGEGY
jgi:hypothetical protein